MFSSWPMYYVLFIVTKIYMHLSKYNDQTKQCNICSYFDTIIVPLYAPAYYIVNIL
jgi:hypothetical protein